MIVKTEADKVFSDMVDVMLDAGLDDATCTTIASMVGRIQAAEWQRGLRAGLDKESE